MTRFADLNPVTMPGYGDPETWGGRTPCNDPPDWWDDIDGDWESLQDLIDNMEEQ